MVGVRWCGAMARHAAKFQDRSGLREAYGLSRLNDDGVGLSQSHGRPSGESDKKNRGERQRPGAHPLTGVAEVEEVAHEATDDAEKSEDGPKVLVTVGTREVIADHDEHDR